MAWKINAPTPTGGRYLYAPRTGEERLIAVLDSEPYQRMARGNDGRDRFTVTFAVVQEVDGKLGAEAQLFDANVVLAKTLEKAYEDGSLECNLWRLSRPGQFVELSLARPLTQAEIDHLRDVPVTTTVQALVEPPASYADCPIG